MTLDHDTLVWMSNYVGLFYLVGLSLIVVVYAYWPSNKAKFDRAAAEILENEDEDRPWR